VADCLKKLKPRVRAVVVSVNARLDPHVVLNVAFLFPPSNHNITPDPVHRGRKRVYAENLTPQLFIWGMLICISPEKSDNNIYIERQYGDYYSNFTDVCSNLSNHANHANCMQHVLRCWERQSDGIEYKKTLRWPGLRPGPRRGAYSASPDP